MATADKWSYSAGEYGSVVTVYEREPGGPIYVRLWDRTKKNGRGGWLRRSLGHRDRRRAKAFAHRETEGLTVGRSELLTKRATLRSIFNVYRKHGTPKKVEGEQKADQRRMEMWSHCVGPEKHPSEISDFELENFITARASGEIDARGNRVPVPRAVGPRTVEADCNWLVGVFNWATKWRMPGGSRLLDENPLSGWKIPPEENPKRPVISQKRFEALRAVAGGHMMTVEWGSSRSEVPSHLPVLLELANGTGRRISAICGLQYEDLMLDKGKHGAIRWRADTDKMRRESIAPINADVRAAVELVLARRKGNGEDPLFPSPRAQNAPMSRHLADKWLRKAEKMAGLEPQKGSLWHAFRRKWVTERKRLPDADVQAVGGWKDARSLKTSYQMADWESMTEVAINGSDD